MSRLSEYLALIPKAIPNLGKVVEGFVNEVKSEFNYLDADAQEEIIRRRLICSTCPNMSKNAKVETKRLEEFCTLCSCPIKTKTASLSSTCGAETWNKNHENKKEVLWQPYESNKS